MKNLKSLLISALLFLPLISLGSCPGNTAGFYNGAVCVTDISNSQFNLNVQPLNYASFLGQSTNIVLTNPLSTTIDVMTTVNGLSLFLPQMNLSNSPKVGTILILNNLSSTNFFNVRMWSGTPLALTMYPGTTAILYVTSNATFNGSWSFKQLGAIASYNGLGSALAGDVNSNINVQVDNSTIGVNGSNQLQTLGLSGDVSSSAGSASTTVNSVGGSSAANVHSAEQLANAATSSNTFSTIVKRDSSGNISATTVTAALNGNASTVTTNANLTGDITSSGNTTTYNNVVPVTKGGTNLSSTTANQLLYSSATNTIAGLATANNDVLATNGSGVPALTSTLPSAVQSNITGLGAVTSGSLDGVNIGATTPATGAFTTLSANTSETFSNLTASTVPYLNASKQLTSSAVTPTELGFVSGVTSAIQTQLSNRLIASNNLSDVSNNTTARNNLALGTGNSPQFSAVSLGTSNLLTGAQIDLGNNTANTKIALFDDGTAANVYGIGLQGDQFRFSLGNVSSNFFSFYNNAAGSKELMRITALGSTIINNSGALATSATDGFLYIPTTAGAPTGTPTSFSGHVAINYDTTNNKLCVYNSGWKCVVLN